MPEERPNLEPEETEDDKTEERESILTSVKKLLGYPKELTEFDTDIILNINAAIVRLMQLGVGPTDPVFVISDDKTTYVDYLGDRSDLIGMVKMYLVYKTKLGFDSANSSATYVKLLQDNIHELEFCLNTEMEEHKAFKEPIIDEEESEEDDV